MHRRSLFSLYTPSHPEHTYRLRIQFDFVPPLLNKNENFALEIVCIFPAPYQQHYNRTSKELRMYCSAVTRTQGNHKHPIATPKQKWTRHNCCAAVLLFTFPSAAQQPTTGLGRLTAQISRSHTNTHKRARTGDRTPLDEWSARRRGRHLHSTQQTDIHGLSRIRTRDSSNREVADLRLRPYGHWNVQYFYYCPVLMFI